MNKSIVSAVLAISALTGCQTSSYVSSAATDGDGVTCDEIYQAFDAYNSDRQSAQYLAQLSEVVYPGSGSMAQQGVSSAESYYEQIKASANIALAVRGCQPVK